MQEETVLQLWGFNNFVLRLRDLKFCAIDDSFGDFNKAETILSGPDKGLRASKKDLFLRDINRKILDNAFKKSQEQPEETPLDHYGLGLRQDDFAIAAKAALALHSSLAFAKLILDVQRHPMVTRVERKAATQC